MNIFVLRSLLSNEAFQVKQMRYLTEFQRKNSFENFHCEIWKLFLELEFLFDFFHKKARKLKDAESEQGKASLTKLWLATDKANRSPVV